MRATALPLPSFVTLVAIAFAASCGPSPTPTRPHAGGTPSASSSSSAQKSSTVGVVGGRARNVLLPSDRWVPRDTLDVGGGATLWVGNGGERWLANADGSVTPATTLAPEDLVAVRRASDGSLVLLGRSGATYPVKTALAELTGKRLPPETFRKVAAGKSAIVAVTSAGAVMRTTDSGVTWTALTMPKGEGLLVELQMSERGEGIALYAPQRFLATTDDGATFGPLASPGIGALRVDRAIGGDLFIEGVGLNDNTSGDGLAGLKSPGPFAVLRTSPTRLESAASVKARPTRMPLPEGYRWLGYATAVNDGRAVVLGSRYFEVINDRIGDDEVTMLATYELGKKTTVARIPGLPVCSETYLSGWGKILAVGCVHERDPDTSAHYVLEIVKSDDLGATWNAMGSVEWGEARSRHLLVTSKGSILVDGACLPPRDDTCGTQGPLVRLPGAKGFVKSTLPLGPQKEVPVFQRWIGAPDDDRVFAIGRVGDDLMFRLYLSKDAGKSFTMKPLPITNGIVTSLDEVTDLYFDDKTLVTLFPGDESLLMRYSTKDDGASFESRALPLDANAIVSMAGKRGLAWTTEGARETMDGGLTWGEVTLPERRDAEGGGLACFAEGCLVGERAVRLGWELERPEDAKPAKKAEPRKAKSVARTGLRCTLEGTEVPLGAIEATLADPDPTTAWVAMKRAPNGAISALRLPRGKAAKDAVEVPLLAASTLAKEDLATYEVTRPDGFVALRFAVKRDAPTTAGKPEKTPPKGSPITKQQPIDLEVAWYVASTGKAHKATIKGVGELDPGKHVYTGKDGALRMRAMAWIAPGHGLYLRPFVVKDSRDLWLVTEAGKTTKLALPSLPQRPITTVREPKGTLFVAIENEYHGALQVFVSSLLDAGGSSSRWWSLWPRPEPRPRDPNVRATTMTLSGEPFLVLLSSGDAQLPAVSFAMPLKNAGNDPVDVFSLPRAKELDDPPRVCDATALKGGRLELPYMTGTRHPVTIKSEKRELVWATNDTIARFIRGKPACSSALLAGESRPSPGESAIILPDDLANATLFHDKIVAGQHTVVGQTMRCAYTKDPLPKALFNHEGFVEH